MCIKVGWWNNSILWCRVEKASNYYVEVLMYLFSWGWGHNSYCLNYTNNKLKFCKFYNVPSEIADTKIRWMHVPVIDTENCIAWICVYVKWEMWRLKARIYYWYGQALCVFTCNGTVVWCIWDLCVILTVDCSYTIPTNPINVLMFFWPCIII